MKLLPQSASYSARQPDIEIRFTARRCSELEPPRLGREAPGPECQNDTFVSSFYGSSAGWAGVPASSASAIVVSMGNLFDGAGPVVSVSSNTVLWSALTPATSRERAGGANGAPFPRGADVPPGRAEFVPGRLPQDIWRVYYSGGWNGSRVRGATG